MHTMIRAYLPAATHRGDNTHCDRAPCYWERRKVPGLAVAIGNSPWSRLCWLISRRRGRRFRGWFTGSRQQTRMIFISIANDTTSYSSAGLFRFWGLALLQFGVCRSWLMNGMRYVWSINGIIDDRIIVFVQVRFRIIICICGHTWCIDAGPG